MVDLPGSLLDSLQTWRIGALLAYAPYLEGGWMDFLTSFGGPYLHSASTKPGLHGIPSGSESKCYLFDGWHKI